MLEEGKFSLAISNSKELLQFLSQFKSGVLKRDRELNTPSVSMNFAMLTREDRKILCSLSFRANRDEDLEDLANQMQDKLKGFKFTIKDRYPAWTPEVSPFAKELQAIYREFGFSGEFKVIHAGLESAIIKSKFKNVQICSIGPNILYPHSKKEMVEIASIDRVYRVLERVVELNS
jgi:dipeptidase D